MNITVFGANGRVGSAACKIAAQRKHNVCKIDLNLPQDNTFCPDVTIDFSTPDATTQVVDYCIAHRCPLVSGVTGQNAAQQRLLDSLSRQVTVRQSANFAEGMTAFLEICRKFTTLCPSWNVDIVETHRKTKIDSPSGTAKKIAAVVAKERGTFSDVTIHALRSGDNFGRHEVVFGGTGESVKLVHQAQSVDVFALGAIKCAESIVCKK